MADRFSIHQQIEEIDRELRLRRDVYPRWVRQGKMKAGQAEYFLARMTAARVTLQWLADHEQVIKELYAARLRSTSPDNAAAASSGE
jgi:hypothetical protein